MDSQQMKIQDFSPKLLGVWRQPPSPLPRALLITLVLLLAGVMLWAFYGRLDVVARARGRLVPKSRVQIVQPFEDGRVAKILVREGERVSAGQPLMRMDARLAEVDTEELQRELGETGLQLRRIAAELDGAALQRRPGDDAGRFRQILAQYQADRRAYTDAVAEQQATRARARRELARARQVLHKLKEMLPIYRQTEAAYARLGRGGNAAQLDILQRRRDRIQVETDLKKQRRTVAGLDGTIAEATAQLASLKANHERKLVEARVELTDKRTRLAAKLRKQAYRNDLRVLTAPQDGVVKDIATHTAGYVVPSGTVLMTLVPADEPLQAQVFVDNRDIGFVRPGQEARLKLAAYPFQRFGAVAASVHVLSPDALGSQRAARDESAVAPQGIYRAVLDLDRQALAYNGRRLPLRAGMAVTAEIKLGERSVMEYLLSPIERTLDYAAKER